MEKLNVKNTSETRAAEKVGGHCSNKQLCGEERWMLPSARLQKQKPADKTKYPAACRDCDQYTVNYNQLDLRMQTDCPKKNK